MLRRHWHPVGSAAAVGDGPAAYRLLVKARTGIAAKELQSETETFLKRRNKDGGWGQLPGAASDAYATGQALYLLSLAGVILHFKVLDKPVPSRLIVLSQFGMWLVASVVIGGVLIWFGR